MMSTCSRESAFFFLTEAYFCSGTSLFRGKKISKNRLVCKNASYHKLNSLSTTKRLLRILNFMCKVMKHTVILSAKISYNNINNYLLPRGRSLRENLRPRLCRIDLAIARSIRQGRGLRFSNKDRPWEVNKVVCYMAFYLAFAGP